MPTIYVFCGIPASGKTTESRKLSECYKIKLYCFDEIYRLQHTRERDSIRLDIYTDMANDIKAGYDVVYDDLNIERHNRKTLLHTLLGVDCKKILIVMTTPLEKCISRNKTRIARVSEKTIYRLNNSFQQPSLKEGWDEIFYIENNNSNQN